MIVRELIDRLLDCPLNAEVKLYDDRAHERVLTTGGRATEREDALRTITDVTSTMAPRGPGGTKSRVILNGR